MLARAVRRRDALRHVRQAAEQIQLPFLCPALLQAANPPWQSRSIASRPSSSPKSAAPVQRSPARQLASVASPMDIFDRDDDELGHRFTGGTQSNLAPDRSQDKRRSFPEPSALPGHLDIADIIMIDKTLAQPPDRPQGSQLAAREIRGNSDELLTTIEACLQVHRWDRAMALLRQLVFLNQSHPQQLLEAFNRILEAMVLDMVYNHNTSHAERINNWVEVDMKNGNVEPDAKTYALKIKGALATLSGSRRDRTVRRYWELAKHYNVESEVASLRKILSDSDLGKLSEICPLQFDLDVPPEEIDAGAEPEPEIEATAEIEVAQKAPCQVRETAQKGMGLASLRRSLSLFFRPSHSADATDTQLDTGKNLDKSVRQSRLETDAVDAAVTRWRIEHENMAKMGITGNLSHGKLGAVLWQWYQVLTEKIIKEMELVQEAEAKKIKTSQEKTRAEYGPFLRLLEPELIAATTTITVLQCLSRKGIETPMPLARLVVDLGRAIELEAIAEKSRQTRGGMSRSAQMRVDFISNSSPRSQETSLATNGFHHASSHLYTKNLRWSAAIHARVGAILCELLLDSAKIPLSREDETTGKLVEYAQPALQRSIVWKAGRRVGMVSSHPSLVEMLMSQPPGDLIAKQMPMICPPRPWSSFYEGGFLETRSAFLRIKYSEYAQREYAEAAAARGDLDTFFAGVDVLGRTAWRINRDVFTVMLDAWNSGEAIANLAPANPAFPEVPKPPEEADAFTKHSYYRAVRDLENEKGGIHSNRCFQNFQMEVAKAYLDETFYLPHNVDFRGRAYPMPPYLNQMGADNCRGLMEFARGRPLGAEGLRWLKIHLANVYGFDKASLTDREHFPMDHLDDVLDSAHHPLDGRRWWLTAEDPWQCLAACFELTHALELPDPTRFVSHIPIHQDGSCNGLQHYAALGGDIDGAKQVNLEPGEKPADVYSGVAELVKAEIKEDAAQGDGLAQELVGKITRKIVKQTVMTNVYGVTFLGAIRQVRRQLDDLVPEIKAKDLSGKAATYIARKIFKSLGAMFAGAHGIQYWLGDCANRISVSVSPAQQEKIAKIGVPPRSPRSAKLSRQQQLKENRHFDLASFRSSVIWTTPLKLPVVQPYRVAKGHYIKTHIQRIMLQEPSIADSINRRKQLQAFPPNFIHSLDATHMILSALKADELGLTFSAVHDSFWTHAADVPTLNRLLRDAFIRMHSEDIIGRLAAEFNARYGGHLYLAMVYRHSPLGERLREYRKSLKLKGCRGMDDRRYRELLREIQRNKLLASFDPAERKQGEAMVTASTIFDECDGWQYLYHKDSLGQTAIGSVPHNTSSDAIESALSTCDLVDREVLPAEKLDLQRSLELASDTEATKDTDEEDGVTHTIGDVVDPVNDDGQAHADADAASSTAAATAAANTDGASPSPFQVKPRPRRPPKPSVTWLWLPLTFREVPKRGAFDVGRVGASTYFFS